jgi:hypothetical protein
VYSCMCVQVCTHIQLYTCTKVHKQLMALTCTKFSTYLVQLYMYHSYSCRRRYRCLPRRVLCMRCTPHTQIMLIVAICCNQFATVCNRLKLFARDFKKLFETVCNRLQLFETVQNCLQLIAPVCTRWHQIAPVCTWLQICLQICAQICCRYVCRSVADLFADLLPKQIGCRSVCRQFGLNLLQIIVLMNTTSIRRMQSLKK